MQQVAPATNAHGNSNSTQYPKPGNYGSSYGSGYESLSASQDYSKGGGGYAGGHSGGQTASKTGVGANAPSTGSSGTDIYNKAHVALSKVNVSYAVLYLAYRITKILFNLLDFNSSFFRQPMYPIFN